MTNLNKIHDLATAWVKEAGSQIASQLNQDLSVETKTGPNDLVTNLDVQTEKFLTGKIRANFPNHRIVSEEGFGDKLSDLKGPVWFVDPIDGTLNFVKQRENFCIMLAYYENGVGQLAYIYDLVGDRFYHVIKGQGAYCNDNPITGLLDRRLDQGLLAFNSKILIDSSRTKLQGLLDQTLGLRLYGSAGMEAMEVLMSRTVAYIASHLKPWDYAPAAVFMAEMGGKISDFQGQDPDFLTESEIIIANKLAHQEILDHLHQK